MKYHTVKRLAAVGAVALALALGVHDANAQATATIGADFSTAAALAAAAGNDIDFGTWVASVQAPDTALVIALGAVNTGSPAVPTPTGSTVSTIVNTVAPGPGGSVTVTSPIATTVEIQGTIAADFSDGDLTLSNLVYTDTVVTDTAIPAAFDGTTVATITAPAAPETIGIGATLTIGPGSPAEGTGFSDGSVTIDFIY